MLIGGTMSMIIGAVLKAQVASTVVLLAGRREEQYSCCNKITI